MTVLSDPARARTGIEDWIYDPLTSELVSAHDVDGLVDLLDRLRAAQSRFLLAAGQTQRALARAAPGNGRTRRLSGIRRRVRVVFPDSAWDQRTLRLAWLRFPLEREGILRIESLAVQTRALDQPQPGPVGVSDALLEMVRSARRPPSRNPRVFIER